MCVGSWTAGSDYAKARRDGHGPAVNWPERERLRLGQRLGYSEEISSKGSVYDSARPMGMRPMWRENIPALARS